MAYAKRIDANQTEIVETLRKAGADVYILSMVGRGIPDLMVCFNGETILMEVKANAKSRFTPDQLKFIANWKGGPLSRVDSPEAALRVIGLIPAHQNDIM
jgi:Holliday junction resolvase